MKKILLQAREVNYSWGNNLVLDHFSLELMQGCVVCLMGVNGCGKSTFLDCVLGENKPNAGSIEIKGSDITAMKAHERAQLLAYVPQKHEQTFPYTVKHLVAMGRMVYQSGFGSTDENDRSLVGEALLTCGIEHLKDRICTELSGGEMQMVLLARALVQDTPLIVLDEPTAHLDFKNELLFLETIESLVIDKNVSVLMATHSPNQAFHLSSAGLDVQVALMSQGKVVKAGKPEDILTPESLRHYFGVLACMAQGWVQSDEEDTTGEVTKIQQIVPVGTIAKAKEKVSR